MTALLLAAILLPGAAALAGRFRDPCAPGHIGTRATGAAFAAAVALGVLVVADGPGSVVLADADGAAAAGVFADRLGVVLLLLVLGVSAVVQAFAGRYLHGDPAARRFFAVTGLLTTATAVMVTAASLAVLAVAWTVAGFALIRLLALYPELPAAREGARRTARAFLVADGALLAAVLIATFTWGTVDLRDLGTTAPHLAEDSTALTLVACLLVVAALGRCAQLPLQRWLPATLAAPTPVSALLHAGVVNAGGILLVRTSPLFGASATATHLAFAAGAATAVYGTVLMLAKPDVKGALAHSTMGQMGFMVMTCGLGAYAAAVFHLVAHGMYKASLFLGSGAAVRRHVRYAQCPPVALRAAGRTPVALARTTLTLLVPVAVPAAVATVVHPEGPGTQGTTALLLFAAATACALTWGWRRRHPTARGALTAAGTLLVAGLAYLLLLTGAAELLAPSLAGAGEATVSPWLMALPVAALGLAGAVRLAGAGRAAGLHRQFYVLALGAGQVTAGHRPGRRPVVSLRPVPRHPLVTAWAELRS